MLVRNHYRKKLTAGYSFLETALIVAFFLAMGYWNDPDDICMLHTPFSPVVVILAIVTLFHGITNGLFAFGAIGVAMKLAYAEFDLYRFLEYFALVLIYGEFHYYWNREIEEKESRLSYMREKLDEVSNAFYALKISHDQIEKSYIVKPMSIRASVSYIETHLKTASDTPFETLFLPFLAKNFALQDALIVYPGERRPVATLGQASAFDPTDPIYLEALEKKMPSYLDAEKNFEPQRYLAAIPAVVNEEVVAVLLIEKMPFMAFNKDTLVSIAILTDYLYEAQHKVRILDRFPDFFPGFDDHFRFTLHRLVTLDELYGIRAAIAVIRTEDKLLFYRYEKLTQRRLRALDTFSSMRRDNVYIGVTLFPFSGEESIEGFIERIGQEMKELIENDRVAFETFTLKTLSLAQRFVYGEEA